MNEDNKKNIDEELGLGVLGAKGPSKKPSLLLLVLLTTFGVMFALGLSFSTIKFIERNETINSIISNKEDDKDKYVITYAENVGNNERGINLKNQFPISDSQGKRFEGENYVFNFSLIIGKKTNGVYYELTAVPNANNTLNPKYVKIYLEKDGRDVDFSYNKNRKVKVFTDYKKSEYPGTDGVVIYSDTITKEEAKDGKINFVMRMWMSEDAVVDENFLDKTFGVKVNTYATSKK